MVAGHKVTLGKLRRDPDSNGFLPDVRARVAGNQSLLLQAQEPLIEATDQKHSSEKVRCRRFSRFSHRLALYPCSITCHPRQLSLPLMIAVAVAS